MWLVRRAKDEPTGGPSGQPAPQATPQPVAAPTPPFVLPPHLKRFWIVVSSLMAASLIVTIVMFTLSMWLLRKAKEEPTGGPSGGPSGQPAPEATPQPEASPTPPFVLPPNVKKFGIVVLSLMVASLIVTIVIFTLSMWLLRKAKEEPTGEPSGQPAPKATLQPVAATTPPFVLPPHVKWFWIVVLSLMVASLIVTIVMYALYMNARATKFPHEFQFQEVKEHLIRTLGIPELHFQGPLEVAQVVESLPDVIQKEMDDIAVRKQKYKNLLKVPNTKLYTDWDGQGKNPYYFSKEAKNWFDAENFCVSKGAHLVSIQDGEEQAYIRSQLEKKSWIGLTTKNNEEKWGWSDGSRLVSQYWLNGKPNNTQASGRSSQNCAVLVPWLSPRNWKEESCYQLNNWVCEDNRNKDEL